MSSNDVAFYRELWVRLVGDEFTPEKLASRVRADGGVDIENLAQSEILDLIEGRFSGSWVEATFSFSELLASYSVPGGISSPDQVVGWTFASFVIADAIRQGVVDWELQLTNFIDGFLASRDKLETEEAVRIFQRVFCA